VRAIPWKNTALFLLTCMTTLIAGAYWSGLDPFADLNNLLAGLPYAAGLISILLVHEFGHYFASRAHNVESSLPYFIPVPPEIFIFGTMGAVIKMKSPIVTRRALMDIGAYGPIAGFVMALIVSVIGIGMSGYAEPVGGDMFIRFGDPLAFSMLAGLLKGQPPPGTELALHPVAVAGWIGMFVTMLNLMPMGQLDGGHIVCSLLGYSRHRWVSEIAVVILAPVGIVGFLAEFGAPGFPPGLLEYFWPGWAIWAVLLKVIGLRHPPVLYWEPVLDGKRKAAALVSLIIFILTFMPVPVTIS
jgi:membrane-associated protease RseP (regulator of RpoE activity)